MTVIFEGDAVAAVTINEMRYRTMITDYLISFPIDNDMNDYWFQQNGATARTARATIALLRSLFPGRLISKEKTKMVISTGLHDRPT